MKDLPQPWQEWLEVREVAGEAIAQIFHHNLIPEIVALGDMTQGRMNTSSILTH
jgi:hypothetical protein